MIAKESIPIIDYSESKKRGMAEWDRQDRLIKSCGGIVQYIQGPRFTPPHIDRKEGELHDGSREIDHG